MFYYFAHIIISVAITLVIFTHIDSNHFLFIHDEFLVLSNYENIKSFFVLNSNDFGSPNVIPMLVTFFERLYYSLIYFFNIKIINAQILLYFLKFIIITILPFHGLKKCILIMKGESLDRYSLVIVFIISLWYSFNAFTLIYWNALAFSLTILVAYSVAPITFYYFHKYLLITFNKKDAIITSILLFIMSFAMYLFVVFCLFIVIYTFIHLLVYKKGKKSIIIRLLNLSIIVLPLLSFYYFIVFDIAINAREVVNNGGGDTFGSIKGGFLYPLRMLFTWVIYTQWEPRSVLTFHKYFFKISYIISPYILYLYIIFGLIKNKIKVATLAVTVAFLFFLFFIKASQEPFGEIFVYAYNHIPFFRVFRSPDTKFSFGIIFCLSLLLLNYSKEIKKPLFLLSVLFVIIIQGGLVFSGKAIIGEEKNNSSDRIIAIPNEYVEISKYLNKNTLPTGYVLTIPNNSFSTFILGPKEIHIGQDVLPKLVNLPFLMVNENSALTIEAYSRLKDILNDKNMLYLETLPIRYVLIRYDNIDNNISYRYRNNTALKKSIIKKYYTVIEYMDNNYEKVFQNDFFDLYENKNYRPLVYSKNLSFSKTNPIKYNLNFENIKSNQRVFLFESFNKEWKLYIKRNHKNRKKTDIYFFDEYKTQEYREDNNSGYWSDLGLLFKKDLFSETHKKLDNFSNTWVISTDYLKNNYDESYYTVNGDGTISFEIILLYKLQHVFNLVILLIAVYLSFLIVFLIFNKSKPTTFEQNSQFI